MILSFFFGWSNVFIQESCSISQTQKSDLSVSNEKYDEWTLKCRSSLVVN